ncbi:hypothetical protein BJX63DRAFT_443826 [Aspergillus granulosus]|uniref:Uncharacterized protein n=1 Tax=Aspergillus granulosus TaxID=176169 RepID=A0ABR4H8S1_9EURO
MANFRISSADIFLLDRWQEDSPLSIDAQREQIFAEYVALGVSGREPYENRDQDRQLSEQERELLDRVRQPSAERLPVRTGPWLRTCYGPSTEAAWSAIQDNLEGSISNARIYNDASLYNFEPHWEKIFLRAPQLVDYRYPLGDYEDETQEALSEAIEDHGLDPEKARESGYDQDEDANPWPIFYSKLPREVLIVWFDECGRTIRYVREALDEAVEMASLPNYMLNEHDCWVNAKIGKSYRWGQPQGPPYSEPSGDSD